MQTKLSRVIARDSAIVFLLAWVAGSMDAISYIASHVFTANMTGTTVLLGLGIGQRDVSATIKSAFALGGYVLGVAIGVLLVDRRVAQSNTGRAVAGAVLVEAATLFVFSILTWDFPTLVGNPAALYAMIGLAGIAMGIQSAAVKKLRLPGVATTYVTGTITSLTSGLVRGLRSETAGSSHAKSEPEQTDWETRLRVQAGVFLVYGLAALTIGVSHSHWPASSSFIPLIAIVVVAAAVFLPETRPQAAPQ